MYSTVLHLRIRCARVPRISVTKMDAIFTSTGSKYLRCCAWKQRSPVKEHRLIQQNATAAGKFWNDGGPTALRVRRREWQWRGCASAKHGEEKQTSRSGGGGGGLMEFDVVIVGAGIIGIATAHHLLMNTNLSVALVDAVQPCAGATGAGQGYIWMSHRDPGSPGWGLASRSKLLWEELVAELCGSGVSPLQAMGWQNTGSLLVASTSTEAEALQKLVEGVSGEGVAAEYWTTMEAVRAEPALASDHLAAAAFFPQDSQIDARLTVALLQQRINAFGSSGRYVQLFQNPVHHFIRSPQDGHIQGIQTQGGAVYCKKAVVVATGAWSSTLMTQATADWMLPAVPLVKPRKGHLLVLDRLDNIQLQHGIMEFEYLSHSDNLYPAAPEDSESPDVAGSSLELAMTATVDPNGNLLLGSSREFVDFDTNVQYLVVESIMKRAAKFLHGLSHLSVEHVLQNGTVRTGLRPFSADGRPLIGPVDNVPGLIFATGHEGSGLCLALGTAEMVVNTIQGVDSVTEGSFFSPAGRLVSCTSIPLPA